MYANIAAIKGEDILSVVNSGKVICFRELKVIKSKILDKRQLPARIKKRHSDYVINNNKSLNFLKKSVKILQNKL